ncbi:MAG: glycosyltransferase family 2 protein [Phycisphaerales bacterium]|jgi:glycosyltransferase involved in cell wall biosynthesis|nr:glycosyltransferase family 2 protein [Phycisphaerales bacterium]MDP6986888.1 glycosyltransferase family 2 protein [Phycisphaerales bacterium]
MSEPIPITVVVPVKNEAKNLPRCLEQLSRFAKVYVVDSGSDDGTPEVAKHHGAEVVQFRWNGQFPKKRNWFLDNHQLQTDWVLFLDADEIISDEFCDEVDAAARSNQHVGYWLTFHNWFMGKFLRHGDPFSKLAFFRPDAGRYERIDEDRWSHLDMEIHEHPVLDGTIGTIRSPIDHDDRRGLESYIGKHNEYSSWEAKRYLALGPRGSAAWSDLTPRQRSKYGKIERWWFPLAYYLVSLIAKRGFLDGRAGFAIARFKAQYFWHIRLKIKETRTRDST